jgi:hypothetical protein
MIYCVKLDRGKGIYQMTQPHQEFNDDHTPVGYLITFRSYRIWLLP